jgi:hypothetical protein
MVAQNHEPIEEPKADRRHDEQIHCGDSSGVVVQEGLPTLTWWAEAPHHVLGHRGLCHLDPQIQQLTMNTRWAPQRIGKAHLENQASQLARDWRLTAPRARLPAPIETESGSVPAHYGFGPHDGDSIYNRRAQPIKPHEDEPIDDAEPRLACRLPAQDHQLMAKDQNLHFESRPRLEQ